MSKKQWLYLGVGTEVFHLIFFITVLVCGKLWMPGYLVNLAVTITVMGQVVFLWCPLSVFSVYCFHRYNPDVPKTFSITCYLDQRYGRVVGIPIFVFLVIVSTLIGMAVY